MAFPATSLAIVTFVGLHKQTIALNLDAETHKGALFTNAVVGPNLITDTKYGVSPWNANEVPNGSGYTTGGNVIVNTTFAHISVGNCGWDFDDPSWPTSTITARGCLYYADALLDEIILAQTFGADFSSGGGTFTIIEPTNGPATIDFGG